MNQDLTGTRVMVVDHSNTLRRSAELFLLQSGCVVILAEDGFDALAKIADHFPQVILMETKLPRLNGFQACMLTRRNARFHDTPIILLSCKDGPFDRARARMAGADDILAKPFTKIALIDSVRRNLRDANP